MWKKVFELAVKVYAVTENLKDYSMKDQMRRAVVSISSNIAEGFERNYAKEFVQFLFVAKGSAGELRSQARIAIRAGLFNDKAGNELIENCESISRQIMAFIGDIRKRREIKR